MNRTCRNKVKSTFERASQPLELLCRMGTVSHYWRARSGFLNTREVNGREKSTKYLI